MKKLLILMLLIHSQQVFCQRDVFFSGNIYYNTGGNQNVKNGYYISQSLSKSFFMKPSILWKTKKNKIREIELTRFGADSRNTFIDSPDSSFNPRNIISNGDFKNFNFELTHRYYHNFLKKKSDKLTLGFVVSNSVHLGRSIYSPYNQNEYYRKSYEVGSIFELGYGASYTIKKRFLIGLRSKFFRTNLGYVNYYIDDPIYSLAIRNQNSFQFDTQVNIGFQLPTNLVLNLAYHFK